MISTKSLQNLRSFNMLDLRCSGKLIKPIVFWFFSICDFTFREGIFGSRLVLGSDAKKKLIKPGVFWHFFSSGSKLPSVRVLSWDNAISGFEKPLFSLRFLIFLLFRIQKTFIFLAFFDFFVPRNSESLYFPCFFWLFRASGLANSNQGEHLLRAPDPRRRGALSGCVGILFFTPMRTL